MSNKSNKLQGKHHAFDQSLFEKYDIPARDKIKNVLGDFVRDNPDIYKQDLIITDENYKYKYLELQVCCNWIDEYPYEQVYIFERKNCYDENTIFLTLNKNMTKGFIFDATSFKNTKPRRLKKYSREFVYNVPWHRVMPICIDKLTPENFKLY